MKVIRMVTAMFFVLNLTVLFLYPAASVQAAEKNFIRLIVANAPGSAVDNTARAINDRLSKALGKSVIIENFPGAGGIKGTQEIVQAAADGMTIGMVSNNHVINPAIYKKLPFDPIKDITPISIVGTSPLVLVTHQEVPANNINELIAFAKSEPGKLTYGSAGNGTVLHLAGELFCSEAGVKITHVPYKGGSQLLADLLGKHIDMVFFGTGSAVGQIKAGKLRALAVSSPSAILPDVPTLAKSGLPDAGFDGWIAMIGPAKMPKPMVDKINTAVKEALAAKEVREILATQGTEGVGSTPEAAAELFQTDLVKCAKLVKESGMSLE